MKVVVEVEVGAAAALWGFPIVIVVFVIISLLFPLDLFSVFDVGRRRRVCNNDRRRSIIRNSTPPVMLDKSRRRSYDVSGVTVIPLISPVLIFSVLERLLRSVSLRPLSLSVLSCITIVMIPGTLIFIVVIVFCLASPNDVKATSSCFFMVFLPFLVGMVAMGPLLVLE